MRTKSVSEIIDVLSETSSTNEKIAILKSVSDNELLQSLFSFALSPRIKYWIKKIPEYTPKKSSENYLDYDLQCVLDKLYIFSTREKTGNAASQFLKDLLESNVYEISLLLERIIGKDLKCGVSATTVNKVWKSLIPETPYMGAVAFNKKKVEKLFATDKKGVVSQVKADGRYANQLILSDNLIMESRQGEPTLLGGTLDDIFNNSPRKDVVLNGELIIESVPRYESNGLIASIVSINKKIAEGIDTTKEQALFLKENLMTLDEAQKSIVYVVWDLITIEEYNLTFSIRDYDERLAELTDLVAQFNSPRIKLIESKPVYTYDEAIADFYEKVKNGEEGTLLKGLSTKWKDGKPVTQIKVKNEVPLDLVIVGFNYGTKGTKNEYLISSLNCESSDGLLKTRPTGLKEAMMVYITNNQETLLNTIVEVKCSGISHDSTGAYSLLHPVFKEPRDDKISANSLAECLEIENSNKNF